MAISEVVAGRTGKQIEAAKRAQTKRLGQSGAAGKQKRCKKGKSCGASCINSGKVCLVDIPWATGVQITKVAKTIQDRKPSKVNPENASQDSRAKIKDHHEKLKKAAIEENGKEYDKHRKEILKELKKLKDKGEDVPDVPMPTWAKLGPVVREIKDADAKGDKDRKDKATQKLRDLLLGKSSPDAAPKLSPMSTSSEFFNKLLDTTGYYNSSIKEAHYWVGRLIGESTLKAIDSYIKSQPYNSDEEMGKFEKLRASLLKALGKNELEETVKALRNFTAGGYTDIREAQMGIAGPNGKVNKFYLREARRLEKFLARREVPKPPIEKFRGIKVNDQTLQAMIESSRMKGSYSGGALSSWSTQLQTAQNFADKINYGNPNGVIFRTVNAKGVPIGSVSSWEGENEILTPATANYKYVSYRPIVVGGNTYHVFDVEET